MKWIASVFLLLNAVLLLWGFLAESDVEPAAFKKVEMPVGIATIALAVEAEPVPVTDANPAKAICTLMGPFIDASQAQLLIQRLTILDVQSRQERLRLPSGVVFWVHLSPLPSREGARRRLSELQASNIDSYIIPKGELKNGISLGVYTQEALAKERLADMQSEGVEARITEMQRSEEQLWVVLESQERLKIGSDTIQNFIAQGFASQERQNFCLDVASASNFQ